MINKEIALVAQIVLKTNTYYVCDRDYVMLDGITYDNVILSWSDLSYFGNIGNGESQIGDIKVVLNNGEILHSGGYKFSAIDVWNNYTMTIKRWKYGIHMRFIDCDNYTKGIIKDFQISDDKISFTVDTQNTKDSTLIPRIIGEDQTSLSDTESKSLFRIKSHHPDQICPYDYSIFDIGEYVKCTSYEGYIQYNVIKEKTMWGAICWITLQDELSPYWKWSNIPINTIEKAFRHIPKNFVNKIIPMQIGDLSDSSNGVFGKTFTINEKIGEQAIVLDYYQLYDLSNIGVWENLSREYYVADSTTKLDQITTREEYYINSLFKNMIEFVSDTTTTLTDTLLLNDEYIMVADYTLFNWIDEEDTILDNEISTNIIRIDNEIFQLIEKPTTNKVWVERGFNNTVIAEHNSGSKIYQCSNYATKNSLFMTHRFNGRIITNQFYERGYENAYKTLGYWPGHSPPYAYPLNEFPIISGKWSNLINIPNNDPVHLRITNNQFEGDNNFYSDYMNFDVFFNKIEAVYDVVNYYIALKCWVARNFTDGLPGGTPITDGSGIPHDNYNWYLFGLFKQRLDRDAHPMDDVAGSTNYGKIYIDTRFLPIIYINYGTTGGHPDQYFLGYTLDYWNEIYRTKFDSNQYVNTCLSYADEQKTLSIINDKWKFSFSSANHLTHVTVYPSMYRCFIDELKIYNIGLWVDFIVDFTKQVIISPLKGRKITTNVNTIVGGVTVVGELCENIVEVLAHLLTEELKYTTSDFTSNWPIVELYYIDCIKFDVDSPSIPIPKTAFSYGIEDEQKNGWEFCSWLASHFNLQIIKDCDGKIDIINLHEIYKNTPVGYEIKIEDIIFQPESGVKEITIMQTGTDLIYNDIIVKWKRNNSTNEYQEVYKLPDTYVLEKSSITLSQAREDYYNGNKRTLIIESPFIYTKVDAQRLAEWKANDQAEVHFYVDFNLDFDHYSDNNSLTVQYKPGDMIYLTGEHGGIIFDIFKKFYIQNIILIDSGRKIKIQAKSIDSVASWSLS